MQGSFAVIPREAFETLGFHVRTEFEDGAVIKEENRLLNQPVPRGMRRRNARSVQ